MIGLVFYLVGLFLGLVSVSITEKMHALAVQRNDKPKRRLYLAACVVATAVVIVLTALSYYQARGAGGFAQVVYLVVLFFLVFIFGDDFGVRPSKWFTVCVIFILVAIILTFLQLLGVPPFVVPYLHIPIP